MAKEEVYQHNFRLNLTNPQHLKIHKQLMKINKDIYKSKNEYLVRKLYEGMFGDMEEVTEERLCEMEARITKNVMQQLLSFILTNGTIKSADTSADVMNKSEATKKKEPEMEDINEEVASVALGYFDDWSDTDDE